MIKRYYYLVPLALATALAAYADRRLIGVTVGMFVASLIYAAVDYYRSRRTRK